jgi:adenosylhomocysteine nucleosidase
VPHDQCPDLVPIAGQHVLFVMAADAEYGPHLRARFNPLFTGVGPIEAAMNGALALGALAHAGRRPDWVVCLGSAGSRVCPLGQVFQVKSVSWRDIDASPFGFARGVTPFVDHPVDIPLATPLPIASARLSTGGDVLSGDRYAAIDADMVDMETFAIARLCARFKVPLIGLRGISDGPEPPTGLHDWTNLLGHLDEELARTVDLLPNALSPEKSAP